MNPKSSLVIVLLSLLFKALISGLNLRNHLEFDIQTVAENGFCSEKCHFDIAGADSLRVCMLFWQ